MGWAQQRSTAKGDVYSGEQQIHPAGGEIRSRANIVKGFVRLAHLEGHCESPPFMHSSSELHSAL